MELWLHKYTLMTFLFFFLQKLSTPPVRIKFCCHFEKGTATGFPKCKQYKNVQIFS